MNLASMLVAAAAAKMGPRKAFGRSFGKRFTRNAHGWTGWPGRRAAASLRTAGKVRRMR